MGKDKLIATVVSIILGIAFLGTIFSMVYVVTEDKEKKRRL